MVAAAEGPNAMWYRFGYSAEYLASQFEEIREVGKLDIERFGRFINGFVFYYGTNYQPVDVPGQQGG